MDSHPSGSGRFTQNTRLGRITVDHDALRREASELLVLAEHGLEIDVHLRTELVQRLGSLRQRLREHFAFEEEGGYLSDVLRRRPVLKEQIAALESQHASFLHEGAALTEELLSSPPPHGITARVVHLLESLRAHEIAEHELIDAALDDGGRSS